MIEGKPVGSGMQRVWHPNALEGYEHESACVQPWLPLISLLFKPKKPKYCKTVEKVKTDDESFPVPTQSLSSYRDED